MEPRAGCAHGLLCGTSDKGRLWQVAPPLDGAAGVPALPHTVHAAYAPRLRERAHIYFAYRPKVDVPEPRGLGDVERFSRPTSARTSW